MTDRPDIPYNAVLCRYGEIALKKGNRRQFEAQLAANMRRALPEIDELKTVYDRGRMLLRKKKRRPFTETERTAIEKNLPHVFGLTSISLGVVVDAEIEAIEELIFGHFPAILDQYPDGPVSYRMRARRSNKKFPLKSKEMEIRFADKLRELYPRIVVDLVNAELTVQLEVRDKWAFVSFDSIPGPGGLPTGSSAPALVLLSGGIDSPVASYLMMGRGCHVDFITFHSYPYTTPELIEKVAKLSRRLNQFQKPGRLFACNLAKAQKMIRDGCSERFRTILYRRLMFRVAERLAKMIKCEALVTGESLGQVASQTVPNMDAINRATDMLVLRPLIGIDKLQTTRIAERIGTLDTSNVQCADSCTVFMPRQPSTNARYHLLDREEANLDSDAMLSLCLQEVKRVNLDTAELEGVPWWEDLAEAGEGGGGGESDDTTG